MRWSLRPIRHADYPMDGEAALRPLAAMSMAGEGDPKTSHKPDEAVDLTPAAKTSTRRGRGTQLDRPGAGTQIVDRDGARNGVGEGGNSHLDDEEKPQPSDASGVDEDMATLVLDNP